jgi:hypothetical protein
MTTEEAVEMVLDGEVWDPCPHCDRGITKEGPAERCTFCEGSGAQLNPIYYEACKLVGKEPPPRWKVTKEMGRTYVSGPPVYVGKFPIGQRLYPLVEKGGFAMQKLKEIQEAVKIELPSPESTSY